MTTKIQPNLIREQTTSISPNQLTAPLADVSCRCRRDSHCEILTDVDQDDDDPKYSHPRSDRDGISPELQHSVHSLKLIRNRDEVAEPVSPTDSEPSSGIDEFVRPLYESRWQRVPVSHVQPRCDDHHRAQANSHHSHLADTLRYRPDHRPRQQVSHKDSSRTTRRQTCARAKP